MNLKDIDNAYDLVVVGGGVTGAGVFSRAVTMGYKVLLAEARDFAWGTSSRSSKMVHGGLRYLKQGKLFLTRSSVKERERLLSAYPGLVTPLDFIMPILKGAGPSKTVMLTGLCLYSLMAGQRQHKAYDRGRALDLVPWLDSPAFTGAVGFKDAQVDDARLVLRLIFDALDLGGHALNHTRVASLERDGRGRVRRVTLTDAEASFSREIQTRAVINATGAFAETLHPSPVRDMHIRPLRGSHLIFPGNCLSLDRVVSFIHPRDKRPVFIFPWQGAVVLGTTDVDHGKTVSLSKEPGISKEEITYLMEGVREAFPSVSLDPGDAVAATAGIRPVLSRGKKSASGESRDHVVWKDRNLVTVTGGKLTTFSLLARDALKAASAWLPAARREKTALPAQGCETLGPHVDADPETRLTLSGRYGRRLGDLFPWLTPENSKTVPGTRTLWAELIHGAGKEEIRHLSDLLLRRVRIGLLLPNGGMEIMGEIRNRIAPVLDWDDRRWEREISDYEKTWKAAHAPERPS